MSKTATFQQKLPDYDMALYALSPALQQAAAVAVEITQNTQGPVVNFYAVQQGDRPSDEAFRSVQAKNTTEALAQMGYQERGVTRPVHSAERAKFIRSQMG